MGEFAVREAAGPLPLIPILGYRSLCEIPFAVEQIDSIRLAYSNNTASPGGRNNCGKYICLFSRCNNPLQCQWWDATDMSKPKYGKV